MDFKTLTKDQLTDYEAIIYLLVKSGLSYGDIAKRLGMSRSNIHQTYDKACGKVIKRSKD